MIQRAPRRWVRLVEYMDDSDGPPLRVAAGMVAVLTPTCQVCQGRTIKLLMERQLERYARGEHVQDVWPELSAPEREVLISGTHQECWKEMFGTED